jgi:outer membrane protein assembly factor BamB
MVWSVPIGPGYAGLTVVGPRLYTLDRISTPGQTPDGQERICCLDIASGKLLWERAYPAHYDNLDYGFGPRGNAAVVEGTLYTLGAVGMASALDANTGEIRWQKDLREQEAARIPTWGLAATPLVVGSQVIYHAGLPQGSIVSLDRASGKERWRSIPDSAGYSTPVLIHAPFGPQLVVWTPENIHGVHPDTGAIDWTVPYRVTYGVSIATPIYHDGIVFVSGYWEGSKGIRLGPARNEAKLLYEENRWLRGLMAPPLQANGVGFLLDKRHGLTCFEIATGRKKWDDANKLTPSGTNPQMTLVWTGQGREILAFNSDGDLIRAELADEGYREIDRVHLIDAAPPSQTLWANPAFAGDSVYVRSDREIIRYKLLP